MKARKLLATLLALAMTLSMLSVGALAAETENEKNGVMPISETGETAPVSNLPADAAASWAASSIERWTATGIVKGDGNGNFNPNAQLTRGELAKIFEAMFGLTVKAENTFGDLNGSEWYADAVLKCVAAGIMKGDGVNVNAENNISRGETIVMFGRAVGVTPDENPDLSKFTDGASVADWAAGYLAPLTKMGILSGSGDGTINAVGNIDRASVMSLLDKSVAEYVNAPGEYKVDDANKFVVVNMSAKEGEIIISGTTAGVTVSAGTAEGKIVAKDLKADTIKVDGAAALNVEGKSSVGEVVANATGTVTIAKGVTVDTVTANAAAKITNNGTVNTLVPNANGIVFDGTKPKKVEPNPDVDPPKNSNGQTVTGSEGSNNNSSSGGPSEPSVTYADIIAATLHDTRNTNGATAGTFVADADIAKNYSVSGTVSGGDVNVTVTANHLMQHKAGDVAGLGYWVGVGIPQSTSETANEYAVGFGAYDKNNTTFNATRDNTMEQNSKTYDTFYFGMTDSSKTGYIAVKNGEKVTVYNITFTVTLAPVVENVKVFAVYDEDTYNQLPDSYLHMEGVEGGYPWDDSYAITNPGGSACGLPWLVVTYDRNVPSIAFTMTKNNANVTISEGVVSPATIGAGRYQMWRMGEHLGQTDTYGTYAVTMTANGKSVTASAEYLDKTAVYHTVTFDGAQALKVKAGDVINAPADPTKTGYAFDSWHKDTTEGDALESGTTTAVVGDNLTAGTIAYVSKWTPNEYTLTYNYHDATAGNTSADKKVNFDAAYGDLPTPTKTGYTLKGWFTAAEGGTQVTKDTKMTTENATIHAQWTAKDCTLAYDLNYTGAPTAPASKTVKFAAAYGELATPTRAGYTLAGWYKEAECTNEVTATTTIAAEGTTTIYAKWTSVASIGAMSNDVYLADYTSWVGHPASVTDFGTLTYTPGEGNAIKVTGTAKYITGFTGFDPTITSGNFLAVQIAVPDGTVLPTDKTTQIGSRGVNDSSPTTGDSVVTVGVHSYVPLLITTANKTNDQLKSYKISVYWDGVAANKTTYILDFSEVVLEAAPPAATFTDWSPEMYTLYKGTSSFGTNMPANKTAFGTGLTYTPGTGVNATKIAVTGTLNYVTGWTGFNSTVEAEQNGYYAMFQVAAPSNVAAAPAVIITRPNGEGETKDLTASVLDEVGGTKYYSIVLYLGITETSKFSDSYEITFDWDGKNTGADSTTYTLDFSAVEWKATALGHTVQQTDADTISYTLKTDTDTFALVSDDIKNVGVLKENGEFKLLSIVTHVQGNCPAEDGPDTAGKMCMLGSDDANEHDKALTVLKTATDKYFFWTVDGCFSFEIPSASV